MQRTRQSLLALLAALTLVFTQLASAETPITPTQQQPADNPEVTVASRLAAAHTVYLQDQAADPLFPTTRGDGYTAFVAQMQSWNRFTLVSSPAAADLVLQFHAGINPPNNPYFRLTFADPATLAPLWIVTVPVLYGTYKKVDLFQQSVVGVTAQVQMLTGMPLSAAQQQAIVYGTTPSHRHREGWIVGGVILGVIVGTAVATPILMHNAYENDLAKQKASQDAFCEANHIPLSECAGG